MIDFDESYFEEEVRDGFRIAPMMKRAWAAQMEVLMEVDRVCRANAIRYFVNWGTLLGAVRHKGFVPWDDDIDIVMLRDDYQKFCKVAKSQLPAGYDIVNVHQYKDYSNLIARVVNSHFVEFNEERLTRFHGCPYVVGVDIDILDYKSPNPEEDELQLQLVDIVLESLLVIQGYENDEVSIDELRPFLDQVTDLCNVRLNYDVSVKQQLRVLSEYLCMLYTRDEATEVQGLIYRISNRPNYSMPKEWFEDVIYMPFEGVIEVPVPKGYDAFLRLEYGDQYMTPIRGGNGRDYPFYQGQERELVDLLKKNNMTGELFDIDMSKYE